MKMVNVFVDENGKYGNPVGISIDTENKLNSTERQKLATNSGFSEVVFINNIETRNISIYTPQNEIPFAGHAVVGTAYFLSEEYKTAVTQLNGIRGVIKTWRVGDLTWVQSKLSITPAWNFDQLNNPKEVEEITTETAKTKEHTFVWAWIDEKKGIIRARTFATDWGIPEDEANGSGSLKLAYILNRELTIKHGNGSVVYAKPFDKEEAIVGGMVNIL